MKTAFTTNFKFTLLKSIDKMLLLRLPTIYFKSITAVKI